MSWIKKLTVGLLALIGISFFVFGSQPDADAPAGFTVVEYWEKWVGTEALQMQEIVDDFNNTIGRRQKIYVRFMSMTDVDQKTLVAIAGGVPPDVAGLWDQQVSQFASLGAVEPLDDLAAERGITADTYLPVFWNACHYNGHLYGLVSTAGTVALIYNKQIFQQSADQLRRAGLDPNRAPRTLDEFDRYAAALDTVNAQGQIDRAGFAPLQGWYFPLISYWFGGDIFDPATHRFTIDSPQTIAAYRWMQGYSRRLGSQALMDFQNSLGAFDSPQNPFLVGKLAMQQQGPWMANRINHLKPSLSEVLVPKDKEYTLANRTDNYAWGIAPFPAADPRLVDVSYNSFDVLMIPRGARHPREAFEFMAYINRQDVAEKLDSLHSTNSQLRRVSRQFLERHPNPYIAIYQRLAASPNAHGVPPVPIWPEVFKELNDAAASVALEGADPAVVLHQAQERLQAQYDRYHRMELERMRMGMN